MLELVEDGTTDQHSFDDHIQVGNSPKQIEMWTCDSCCLKFNDVIPYFHHLTSRRHLKSDSHSSPHPCGKVSLDEDQGMWCPEDSPMYCHACDVGTNGLESFVYHLQGERHQKELQRSTQANNDFTKCAEENAKNVLRLKAVLVNRKKYGYHCKRCNMKFTGRSPYKMHVRGRKHAKMIFKSLCRQALNGDSE